MENEVIAPNLACTLYCMEYSLLARLSAHTDWISCSTYIVCIWRNLLVSQFVLYFHEILFSFFVKILKRKCWQTPQNFTTLYFACCNNEEKNFSSFLQQANYNGVKFGGVCKHFLLRKNFHEKRK